MTVTGRQMAAYGDFGLAAISPCRSDGGHRVIGVGVLIIRYTVGSEATHLKTPC